MYLVVKRQPSIATFFTHDWIYCFSEKCHFGETNGENVWTKTRIHLKDANISKRLTCLLVCNTDQPTDLSLHLNNPLMHSPMSIRSSISAVLNLKELFNCFAGIFYIADSMQRHSIYFIFFLLNIQKHIVQGHQNRDEELEVKAQTDSYLKNNKGFLLEFFTSRPEAKFMVSSA